MNPDGHWVIHRIAARLEAAADVARSVMESQE